MKKSGRILAFILCLSLLLPGCGSQTATPTGRNNQGGNTSAAPENSERTEQNMPPSSAGLAGYDLTAADYYRFLKVEYAEREKEVTEKGHTLRSFKPATTEPVEIDIYEGDFMDQLSWNEDLYGTISAVVEDFDTDGGLEMLVIGINERSVMDSRFGEVLYDEGAAYDPENRCFYLSLRYYDERDGAISCSYSVGFAMLPMSGWGHMVVGMEKLDEQYELYTYVYSENMSTYGPSYFEVIDVPGDIEKYISAVPQYGLSEVEANKLIFQDKVWEISSTTLYDTFQRISRIDGAQNNLDPEEEAYRDALGEGLLCFINVAYPEWGGDKVVYTLTDYTNFSHYLGTEAEGWSAIEIPQGGARQTPEAPAGLGDDFVSNIEAATGITFTSKGSAEENGIITSKLATADNSLTIKWDTGKNVPVFIGWYANDTNTTQEWFDVKDAILSSPVFGWENGDADMLKGQVSWNAYAGNITIGDYSCGIANVVGASMNIMRQP